MLHIQRVRSSVDPAVPSIPTAPIVPPTRHELHRVVDGDWTPPEPSRRELRTSLAIGLGPVAMLPAVKLLFEAWPEAPREIAAAIASLPLLALVLVAITWGAEGGRP